jgi:hypothetical protein
MVRSGFVADGAPEVGLIVTAKVSPTSADKVAHVSVAANEL